MMKCKIIYEQEFHSEYVIQVNMKTRFKIVHKQLKEVDKET